MDNPLIVSGNNLIRGDLANVDNNMLFPLINKFSGAEANLGPIAELTTKFFWMDRDIFKGLFYINLRNKMPYIKTPKPVKFDKEKFDLIVSYLKKHYNYGTRDIESLKKVIEKSLEDLNYLEKFATDFGLDNKERKLLGLQQLKTDVKPMKESKEKSLFDW